MVNGSMLWDRTRFPDLHMTTIGDRHIHTYKCLPTSAYHVLQNSARDVPNKIAIIADGGCEFTYSRLIELVDDFADYLSVRQRVGPGDRVALALFTGIEFCVALLALSKLAAPAVLLPNKYKQPEMRLLASRAQITLIICEEGFASWFCDMPQGNIPVVVSKPNSVDGYGFAYLIHKNSGAIKAIGELCSESLLMFTSGTTAQSKVVVLKNYNIMHAVVTYHGALGITSDDRSVLPLPIYTITGTVAILMLFLYACSTLYLQKKFDASRVLRCMIDNRLTFLHASPTAFALLIERKDEFPNVPDMRRFACGSSNMPASGILKLRDWMPQADFHTVYGLTETSSPATIFPCGAADSPFIGSSGIPIPGLELMIINDNGDVLPQGDIGEVCMRGAVLLERYLEGGEEAFTDGGWFKSGDLGYVNEHGYLYVVDRKKDIINRGGEKICCYDVENAMHSQPGILEAALVGIPHPLYGEQPVAVVRLEHDFIIDEHELISALAKKLSRFMLPMQIKFVDELPKTPIGKIDKRAIRALFQVQGADYVKS